MGGVNKLCVYDCMCLRDIQYSVGRYIGHCVGGYINGGGECLRV